MRYLIVLYFDFRYKISFFSLIHSAFFSLSCFIIFSILTFILMISARVSSSIFFRITFNMPLNRAVMSSSVMVGGITCMLHLFVSFHFTLVEMEFIFTKFFIIILFLPLIG